MSDGGLIQPVGVDSVSPDESKRLKNEGLYDITVHYEYVGNDKCFKS